MPKHLIYQAKTDTDARTQKLTAAGTVQQKPSLVGLDRRSRDRKDTGKGEWLMDKCFIDIFDLLKVAATKRTCQIISAEALTGEGIGSSVNPVAAGKINRGLVHVTPRPTNVWLIYSTTSN